MHRHDDMIHCRKSAAVDIGRRSHQLTGVLKCICVCVRLFPNRELFIEF